MEFEGRQCRGEWKRKRSERDVIALHEKVEVRSEEEEFLGSWHSGTVIACHRQGSHVQYDVKYDNILNRSDHTVDRVLVSLDVDDIVCPNTSQRENRAFIRPVPPLFEFGKWSLPYGMCVDVYNKDAWREGVIADYEDGSEKRKIFFPDLGDEMIASIDSLRISQDSNEATATWQQRGIWLLVELVEKYEQCFYSPVSVKQLWYEMQERQGFAKLGEWTSGVKPLWEELLTEVIRDNFKVAVENLFLVSGLSHGTEKLMEFVKPVYDANMRPEGDPMISPDSVPKEKPLDGDNFRPNSFVSQSIKETPSPEQLVSLPPDDKSNMNLSFESNISCHGQAVCALPPPMDLSVLPEYLDEISPENLASNIERVSSSNFNELEGKSPNSKSDRACWLPAGRDIVPGAEFCPDAIITYARTGNRKLAVDVRKHLSYMNWKIEFMKNKTISFRFTSPGGKCYHSLRQLCLDLCRTDARMLSHISQEEQRFSPFSPGDSSSDLTGQSTMSVSPDCYPGLEVVASSYSDVLTVEPEYCPKAIEEWSNRGTEDSVRVNVRQTDMVLRARKHLSALGWVFRYTNCKGRRILYHISPRGRMYCSLRQACKDAMHRTAPGGDCATGRRMKVGSQTEIAQDQLSCKTLSSEFKEVDFQKSENCRTEPSCKTGFSESPELHKIDALPVRSPERKKKNSLRVTTPSQIQIGGGSDTLLIDFPKRTRTPSRRMTELQNVTKCAQPIPMQRSGKRVQRDVLPNSSNNNPRTILSWLIDNNIVLPRAKVYYHAQMYKRPIAEGQITRGGIKCKCCGVVYTLSSFQHHACSNTRQPSRNKYERPAACIFLEDGRSLLDCQIQLINDEKTRSFLAEPPDRLDGSQQQRENDDICSFCHYGGELVLCDQCPSSFHTGCLGMKDIPDGDWFCPSCCCSICGQNELRRETEQIADGSIRNCTQCERKYHVECLHNRTDKPLSNPKEHWFCSQKCEAVFSGLHELLGKPISVGFDDLSWTLFKSKQSDSHELDDFEIEAFAKLTLALDVMHECFEPMEEPYTKRDLVKDVIFSKGSELNRLNFQGFYTALLEKNDELITVATIRVYGGKVAEMPLVGTRFQYRRQGMCHIMLNMLEKKLMDLGIERIILPAVPTLFNSWTGTFGFSKMTEAERLQFVDYIFLDFPDTLMCQKLLTGGQPNLCKDVCRRDNNSYNDGSGLVSGVDQTDTAEEGRFVEQGPVEISTISNTNGGQSLIRQMVTVSQPTHPERELCHSKITVESLAEDLIHEKETRIDVNGSSDFSNEGTDNVIKYKRRKLSACAK